eukprot:4525829-Amphidinium_carterae.1
MFDTAPSSAPASIFGAPVSTGGPAQIFGPQSLLACPGIHCVVIPPLQPWETRTGTETRRCKGALV